MAPSLSSRALRRYLSIGTLAALFVAVGACSSSSPSDDEPDEDDDTDNQMPPKGVEQLGQDCTGACGSADDRKCAIGSEACESNLCLIDPTQPVEHLAYCTVNCTNTPCPAGWICEEIKSFSDPSAERACVAAPKVCGDGVLQLGEVCDGDGDGMMGKCVDCQGFQAVCGDGFVQEGEACDGDSKAGYCSDDCKELTKPSIYFAYFQLEGFLAPDNVEPVVDYQSDMVVVAVPEPGDAEGCGKLDVLDDTADAMRAAYTYCDKVKGTSATITFSLPKKKTDYSGYTDMPEELKGSIRLVYPSLAKDVTMGPEQASYEFSINGDAHLWSSDVDAMNQIFGDVYFRFREYQPDSGTYDVAHFQFQFGWLLPPP